ncbi:hypothetical protein [Polyangium sorediatum]|uniref:Uncharacterized protein n=1 Tax=Polyangium sorediatum TaxID=889274 RepID=A0ABT6P1C6_9BACT|nr:hypothetical protein [Polyangium sorediatum]MDI1434412.1 hypothetical protein [Polyangium sorediatum]
MPFHPPKKPQAILQRSPHSATITQPKMPHPAKGAAADARPPHPATVVQRREAPPHLATSSRTGAVQLLGKSGSPKKALRARVVRPEGKGKSMLAVQRSTTIQRADDDFGEMSLFGDIDGLDNEAPEPPPVVLNLSAFAGQVAGLVDAPLVFRHDLRLIGGASMPMGVIWVSATLEQGTIIDLKVATKQSLGAFRVYWLPWSLATNFVSWDELDSSGINCFMTVPLSGCVVVIAPTGILHVTADTYTQMNDTVKLKLDGDIVAAGGQYVPMDYTWGLFTWPNGYDKKDKEVTNRGLVYGFKDHVGVWRFYCLARVTADGKYSYPSLIVAEDV